VLLEVDHIAVHYGKIAALKDVTLTVDEGEIVALIGANGAGKTTTLKTISGLRPLSAGRIAFEGNDISRMPGHKRVTAGIGQAPEGRGVFPGMTVQENLLMGCYTRKGNVSKELEEVYGLFPRLAERKTQAGGTMSGGEQQMLAIGRALMTNPKLLILDEATEGLAPLIRRQIWGCLERLQQEGLSLLVIDKNVEDLTRVANRHYIIEKGRVVWHGDSTALRSDEQVRHRYLGV
jgi:branched-chain amino acid transport system ATP-binding protein